MIGTPLESTLAACVIMPLSLATLSPAISHAPPHSALKALPPAPPNVLSEVQPSGGRTPEPLPAKPPSKLRLRKLSTLLRSPHQKSREAYPITPAHSPSSTKRNSGSASVPASKAVSEKSSVTPVVVVSAMIICGVLLSPLV